MSAKAITIPIDGMASVSGLWLEPPGASACLVLAHGAGAGMAHKSMMAIAEGLAERRIATLRFQFPYMERGSRRPDPPRIAHAAVRAAIAVGKQRAAKLPLFAGGKSFGGRMTSQAQASTPLDCVRGLVFFGFPLHPAGEPSVERAKHLEGVHLPMLFLQGTRDALAEAALLRETIAGLDKRATARFVDGADHSFHVPKQSGCKDSDVLAELLDCAADWMHKLGNA